jgi:hypothetical protein
MRLKWRGDYIQDIPVKQISGKRSEGKACFVEKGMNPIGSCPS